jgi:hypothetical protein
VNASLRAGPVAASLAIVLAAGCGGGGHRRAGAGSTPTVSTILPGGSTTTPGPPQVPVIACQSSYGVPPSRGGAVLPRVITIDLPRTAADLLSYYTNDTRTLAPILAPRSWPCRAQVGADGTTGFDIRPATGTGTPGVDAASDSACQGCVYSTVCAFVPGAAAQLGYAGLPCPALGAGTRVDFLKGSAATAGPVVDDVIRFTDPTVPTPTRGVVLYRYHAGLGGSASQETCNLPAAAPDLCPAILQAFVRAAWLLRA